MMRLYTSIIFGAIFIILGYIFFVMPLPLYVSQTQFLVTFNDVALASHADHVMNDIVYIAQKKSETDVQTTVHADIARVRNHDILSMTVSAHDVHTVRAQEKAVLAQVFTHIGAFYDMKNDVSVSVLTHDAAPHKNMLVVIAEYITILAVVCGVFSGVRIILHLTQTQRTHALPKIDARNIFGPYAVHTKDTDQYTMDQGDVQDREEPMNDTMESPFITDEDEILEEEIHDDTEDATQDAEAGVDVPKGLVRTPGNLPVTDATDFGLPQTAHADDVAEPTEEELKARLNALLNGKL